MTALLIGTAALGVAGVSLMLYAVGKYNALISVRNKLFIQMIEMDFVSRKQLFEVGQWAKKMGCASIEASDLLLVEEHSHQSVAVPLGNVSLSLLKESVNSISSFWGELLEASLVDSRFGAGVYEDLNLRGGEAVQANERGLRELTALIAAYRAMLKSLPCAFVARVMGFKRID